MEEPGLQGKGRLLHASSSPVTVEDAGQHHCAEHRSFQEGCVSCQRARAAFLPYPVRPGKPVTRSYGFKDDLTEAKLRALDPKVSNLYADDTEFSLSLSVLRFLKKLIWPF